MSGPGKYNYVHTYFYMIQIVIRLVENRVRKSPVHVDMLSPLCPVIDTFKFLNITNAQMQEMICSLKCMQWKLQLSMDYKYCKYTYLNIKLLLNETLESSFQSSTNSHVHYMTFKSRNLVLESHFAFVIQNLVNFIFYLVYYIL